jgi:S-adenosylmethionine:tRNA ribosyltransferase-isomerase
MLRSELAYELPAELIAQRPCVPRDAARLMVLDRRTGRTAHHHVRELPDLLRAGDCLVLNRTRVVPAKFGARRATGGRVEGLFLREIAVGVWSVLLGSRGRLRLGETLRLGDGPQEIALLSSEGDGMWRVRVAPAEAAVEVLSRVGRTPLPPYIKRVANDPNDPDRATYQTVYAAEPGAVAAPTAGLHFTPALLEQLAASGIHRAEVVLHVGLGTFQPIAVEDLAEHRMHAEWYELDANAAAIINTARASGGRIVAVGTTSTRVLETCASSGRDIEPGSGWTDLFIVPPYDFKIVDGLLTNFHLPHSTLLALIFAVAGRERVISAYAEAVRERYRFYSYGDAMLIV